MWAGELIVMLVMILINSVFAAYEIALASISLARLEHLVSERRKGASAALYMKRNLEGSLAGIQLGITLVGAIAAATGGAGAEEQLAPILQQRLGLSSDWAEVFAIAAIVAPLTIVTIIFGELIPKVFALRNKEWVCLLISPWMKWFVTIVRPIVWALESVVTAFMSWGERRFPPGRGEGKSEAAELQELRASVVVARTSRLIGVQEEKIILGAAGLTSRSVSEILLPAEGISMLLADGDIADALVAAHLDMHTRFPVTERKGDPQAIIGYVNFKDIIAHMRLAPHVGASIRKIMRPIPSFSAATLVSVCLEQLIREHIHIALVRDENGTVLGMITLEDIIEELVGDIEDEYDSLPTHMVNSGPGWVVGGGISPEKFRERTGLELPGFEGEPLPRNLNEWVIRKVPTPLRGGEIVEQGTLRVVVRKVRRHKVLEALISERPSTEIGSTMASPIS